MIDKDKVEDEQAPFPGSWTAWYVLVLAGLFICIAAFYWFTKTFS